MEKDVSRNLMNVEQVYDNVPQHIKEYAHMPNRYFDLTNDQQRFFDVFAERAFFPAFEELEYECDKLRDIAEQLTEALQDND